MAEAACAAGLAGYEFASGIPGTVGGAAVMNAGAYGGEFADVATSVRCLAPDGSLVEVPAKDAGWGYRRSMMGDAGLVVLGAALRLARDPEGPHAVRARMDDLARRRAEKQPLELPSAGSTFKRPEGHFAGKLVQDAGLRGFRIGGAQVSEKHTGFVVNAGGATADDVRRLIAEVCRRVREASGVTLEPEVRMWGFEEPFGTGLFDAGPFSVSQCRMISKQMFHVKHLFLPCPLAPCSPSARGRGGKARGRSKEAGAQTGPASWFHPHPARGAAEGRNADGRPFRDRVRKRFGKGGSFAAGRRGRRGCRKRRERQGRERALLRFAGIFADPAREGRLRRGPCEADPPHAGRGGGTREKGG